jgi:hypothetical protein
MNCWTILPIMSIELNSDRAHEYFCIKSTSVTNTRYVIRYVALVTLDMFQIQ